MVHTWPPNRDWWESWRIQQVVSLSLSSQSLCIMLFGVMPYSMWMMLLMCCTFHFRIIAHCLFESVMDDTQLRKACGSYVFHQRPKEIRHQISNPDINVIATFSIQTTMLHDKPNYHRSVSSVSSSGWNWASLPSRGTASDGWFGCKKTGELAAGSLRICIKRKFIWTKPAFFGFKMFIFQGYN